MKLSRTFGVLAGTAAMMLAGTVAQARQTTFTSANGGGPWRTAGSWDVGSGYPVAGDIVIVTQNNPITVTNADAAATVSVNASASLQVNASGVLTVTGAITASGTLQINSNGQVSVDDLTVASGGLVQLDGNGASIAELLFPSGAASPSLTINQANGVVLLDSARIRVAKNMSITGSGSLQGQNNTAEISIDTDNVTAVTLQPDVPIHGNLKLAKYDAGSAVATFHNNHASGINADVSGTVTLGANVVFTGSGPWLVSASGAAMVIEANADPSASTGVWTISASGGSMTWNAAASGLSGAFTVAGGGTLTFNVASSSMTSNFIVQANGLINVNQDVTTNGTLSIYCGTNTKIDVNTVNGAEFIYGSVADDDCATPPPATTISADFRCFC